MERKKERYDPSFEDLSFYWDSMHTDLEDLTRLEALSLDAILKEFGSKKVLDCAAGTGVQALGLAKLSYNVSASDISPTMIKILKTKAKKLGLKIRTDVLDFCNLKPWRSENFDAVICAGNSLSLLKNRRQMINAVKEMRRTLQNKGIVVLGLHNYKVPKSRKETLHIRKVDLMGDTSFDVRKFDKTRTNITYFICRRRQGSYTTKVFKKSCAYLDPINAKPILQAAGLKKVKTYDIRGLHKYDGGEWGFAVGSR